MPVSIGNNLEFDGATLNVLPGVPTGFVLPYAGMDTPAGWLECDGSAVSRTTYAALFGKIGTQFGPGDGATTFNLPNPQGRAIVAAGQGAGLTNRALGDTFGAETYTILHDDLPDHSHTVTIGAHSHVFTASPHTHTDNGHGHTVNDPGHDHGYTGVGATGSYPDTGNLAGPNYTSNTTTSELTGITIATGYASLQTAVVSGTTNNGGAFNGNTGGIFAAPINQTAFPLSQPSFVFRLLIKT